MKASILTVPLLSLESPHGDFIIERLEPLYYYSVGLRTLVCLVWVA